MMAGALQSLSTARHQVASAQRHTPSPYRRTALEKELEAYGLRVRVQPCQRLEQKDRGYGEPAVMAECGVQACTPRHSRRREQDDERDGGDDDDDTDDDAMMVKLDADAP
jgi:hypothetical protein